MEVLREIFTKVETKGILNTYISKRASLVKTKKNKLVSYWPVSSGWLSLHPFVDIIRYERKCMKIL